MSEPPRVGAFAIVPSNDLAAAIPFWERLGFARAGDGTGYIIMTGWGCEVHLTQAGAARGGCQRTTTPSAFSFARLMSMPLRRAWTS